jgi:hypothetical protein
LDGTGVLVQAFHTANVLYLIHFVERRVDVMCDVKVSDKYMKVKKRKVVSMLN